MKAFLALIFLFICQFSVAAQPVWYVYYDNDFGTSVMEFRPEVLGTEMIGFSAASGLCATGKTVQECLQYHTAAISTIPAAQVQSDWNAVSGMGVILNKPAFGTAAFVDVPSSGDATSGQAVKGNDSRLSDARTPLSHSQTVSTISDSTVVGRNVLTATDAAAARSAIGAGTSSFNGTFGALASTPTTLGGYGITDAYSSSNPSGYVNQAGARGAISLTTTGSGAATYNSGTGVLNVPTPTASGTVTSITAGTGLSGGTITTSGTISLPNTGTASTYNTVTTDDQGRVTAGTVWSTSCPSRSLNTAYQISTTQMADVRYAIDISVTSLLLAGQEGLAVLEYADNSGMSTNVVTVFDGLNSTGGVLNVTNKATIALVGKIPAGKYVRIRTVNTTGSPTFTYRRGCEDLL